MTVSLLRDLPSHQATQRRRWADMSARRARTALAWVLVGGALLRALLWWYWGDLPLAIDDERSYAALASHLAESGEYADQYGPTSLRPPLYPAAIALVYRALGMESHAVIRALQALIALGTAVVVFRIGRIAFSPAVGLVAAAAVCFYPSLLFFNYLLLSETLFAFLMCGTVVCMLEAVRRRSLSLLFIAGVVLGLGALTRSVLFLCAPPLAVWIVLGWQGRARDRLLAGGLVLGGAALTIAPWSYRNSQLQETFTLIDVMGGRNAMMGNYEHTPLERSWATINTMNDDRAWHRVLARQEPSLAGMTQGQRDKLALRHAVRFVIQHPWLTFKRDVIKFFNFWQLDRTVIAGAQRGFFGHVPPAMFAAVALAICGSCAAAIFGGVLGLLLAPPSDRRAHGILLLMIAVPCIAHTLTFAHSRYALPLMPIVLLYAASAAVHARAIWSGGSRARLWLGLALCSMLALGWLRELVVVDYQWVQRVIG
jgi:4-amino-4-deoxy-L-arabinose transferase-like glycosyltransferase